MIIFPKYDSVVIGPGLGKSSYAREAVLEVLKHFEGPIVVDADAINVISLEKDKEILRQRKILRYLHPTLGR